MIRRWKRRRSLHHACRALPHDQAAQLMRLFAQRTDDPETALVLARRALETAPPGHRYHAELYVRALEAGRRIKVATYPAEFRPLEPELEMDAELERAVREALAGWDD